MNSDTETIVRPCGDDCGTLPACAPLAVPFVPFQQNGAKKYSPTEALSNGTLFPGLNLPFRLKTTPGTPMENGAAELQALCFVIDELGLYLDTHKNDSEAFQLFRQYTKLAEDAKRRYEANYGPVTLVGSASYDKFTWLDDPWPWEYRADGGGK